MVLVDIPEYLAPNEILAVVKHALASRSIPVEDTQVSMERLRWSMGNIRSRIGVCGHRESKGWRGQC